MDIPLIGIVVPTLGKRNDYLVQSLESIRQAGTSFISIVAPNPDEIQASISSLLFDSVLQDPMKGLANAINTGIFNLPESIKYVNWLGDDDLLAKDSLNITSFVLKNCPEFDFVYGKCLYIDKYGKTIWNNKSGSYAQILMRFGPQLVPQPGALFRRETFDSLGGLNINYKAAFDLDLFLRFHKTKKMKYIPVSLASFRWHENSISVGDRTRSVWEASQIRQQNFPKPIRLISPVWEYLVRNLIVKTGRLISYLGNKSSQ